MHSTTVSRLTADRELGVQLGQLRYDCLQQVIMGLVDELERQAFHDFELGRPVLAQRLLHLTNDLASAEHPLEDVVRICQKYIDAEKDVEKRKPVLTNTQYASQNQAFTGYTFRL